MKTTFFEVVFFIPVSYSKVTLQEENSFLIEFQITSSFNSIFYP